MDNTTYTSFAGDRRLVTGDLATMLSATKRHLDAGGEPVIIFDDATGRQTDFDFRGTVEEVLARAKPEQVPTEPVRTGPGRPRLGVVSGEVSLLPRHWEWLNAQPAKASGTIRRLVDEARKQESRDPRRLLDAAAGFMWVMAGNRINFEEASRALYARDWIRFKDLTAQWPADVQDHLATLLAELLQARE